MSYLEIRYLAQCQGFCGIARVTFPTTLFSLHLVSEDRTSQAQLVYMDTWMKLCTPDHEDRVVNFKYLALPVS